MGTKPLRPEDPRQLGGYQLLSRLGEGGMGVVYLARDPAARLVAVKAIRAEYAGHEESRARFRSEVNRVRQVPSFCTAAVIDADADAETPYLVVEYVDGPSLREVVAEQGPVSGGDLHGLAMGVAAALTAIHGAGVIHRDLKPSNVLLSIGLPKVIDFGIARALEVTSQHTRTDQMVGTVGYMAPEQIDPERGDITPATDIFAWGAVVAYAGTGRSPFLADSPMSTAARVLSAEPDLSGLPQSLAGLVARSLAKDPRRRPSANDLVQSLVVGDGPGASTGPARSATQPVAGRFAAGSLLEQLVMDSSAPVTAAVKGPPTIQRDSHPASQRPPGGFSTRRLFYATAALLVLLIAAATVAYARSDDRQKKPAPPAHGAVTASTLVARGPSFFDPLAAPGRFPESSGESGSCRYDGARLRVRSANGSTYQCPGPEDVFSGDQRISIDVVLGNASSCAMLWFRHHGGRSYQLSACAQQIVVEALSGAVVTPTGKVQTTALRPGTRHTLSITIKKQYAVVALDGTDQFAAGSGNADLSSGRILLGASSSRPGATADIGFANLDVRAS